MQANPPLSVAIITKNEAGNLFACLESVAFASQIVVVDSGSTDETLRIAADHGCEIYQEAWRGFGPQKQFAIDRCTSEWVLSLDADERISPELRGEIEAVICDPEARTAYAIPRCSSYCGKFMRHGGWWPDYVTRLFRRGLAHFSDDFIHERIIVDDGALPAGYLKHPIIHDAFGDMEEVVETINRYSTMGAAMMHYRGKRGTLSKALLHGLWSFIHTYVARTGFMDGREGFMLAVSNAEGTYYRYLKLMFLSERDK